MEKFEAKIMAKMGARLGKIKAYLEEVKAEIDAYLQGTKACLGAMKACLEAVEVNQEEIDSVVEHKEVSTGEAAVEYVEASEGRSGDQQPTVGYR
jgi:hypothetical protein